MHHDMVQETWSGGTVRWASSCPIDDHYAGHFFIGRCIAGTELEEGQEGQTWILGILGARCRRRRRPA